MLYKRLLGVDAVTAKSSILASLSQQIQQERVQPGELVGRVHILFNDIEEVVVEVAEGPERDAEQERRAERRTVQQKRGNRQQARHPKQKALEINQLPTFQAAGKFPLRLSFLYVVPELPVLVGSVIDAGCQLERKQRRDSIAHLRKLTGGRPTKDIIVGEGLKPGGLANG